MSNMEEIIELESSDEEQRPPPGKKKKPNQPISTNIMVNIPHGVTIKPVRKRKEKEAPKINNVTTINKPKTQARSSQAKVAPVIRAVKKPVVFPKISPESQALKKLPSCVTVTKTGPSVEHSRTPKKCVKKVNHIKIPNLPKVVELDREATPSKKHHIKIPNSPKVVELDREATPSKKHHIKIPNLPKVVELDREATPSKKHHIKIPNLPKVVELDREATPSKKPRWYARPEESEASPDKINNKNAFIEIVIEDSPVKPKTKQVRKVSNENVITIDDSPNKPQPINPGNDEGSDEEPTANRKVPNSKKRLEYKDETLSTIVEEKTYEIEIDPIAVDEHDIPRSGPSPLNVTFNNAKDQELEITQEEVCVIVNEPVQPKKKKEVCSKDSEDKEFHPVYLQFIDLCLKLENSDDMIKIVDKKIKTYYKQVPKEYTHSEEFIEIVSSKISSIKANPKEMYLYIKDIVDDLNIQRKLVKQMPIQETKSNDGETFTGENDDMEPNKKKQIRKLEKSLKKFNTAIKKLEMQEVDFDDEDGSVYLLTEKYKERIVRIHAKLCQLTSTKMPSEPRLVLDPGPSHAPGPARRLEEWINKKKGFAFPDFHDVLRCVRAANTEDSLGWSEATVMEEARDLFCRCGKKLQRRRQEREWRLATSRLTVDADPAEESDDLKKKLEDNRRLARTNESEVFNKFSDMQNHQNLEAEEIDDKDAEESPIESDDEDNDENSTLENKQKRKDILKKLLKEQAKKSSIEPSNTEGTSDKVEENTELSKPLNVDDDRNSGSDEIGSDVDELHLLQKLRSDNVIHGISSSDSSDLESPIAISDTLESSSDESIISIGLSSDGDAPQNSKADTVGNDVADEKVGSKTALKNKNDIVLSLDIVVDLDSVATKSEEITKLSKERKNNKIAEENTMSDTSYDVLVLSPDTVVVLDSDTTKSEETNKLSKESKKNKLAEENTMSKTFNDALLLSPDTVVVLDSDTTKSEEPNKLSIEIKDNIAKETPSENCKDPLISSHTAVALDCEFGISEETNRLSKETKDNNIGEKTTSENSKEALVLSPETLVDFDTDDAKSEETNKLSKESKDDIAEQTMSKTSNDVSPDATIDFDLGAAKSEAINKLSRESKDNTPEITTNITSNDAVVLSEPGVLSPDTVGGLDSEAEKSEETNKLSKETKDNNIAEKTTNENSKEALVLSPETLVDLDTEDAKSEETNKLSKESKDDIAEQTMSKTSNDATIDFDLDAAKSEATNKLSRESKDNTPEITTNITSNDAVVLSEPGVLSPDTVGGLDSEVEKSEETNKLSKESKDDIAAKTRSKPSDDVSPDAPIDLELDAAKSETTNKLSRESKDDISETTTNITSNDDLCLSSDTVDDLDTDAVKLKETNNLSRETKDNTIAEKTGNTSNEQKTSASVLLNATETVTDKDINQSTATNSEKSKHADPSSTSGVNDTSEIEVTCDDTTHVDLNNAKFVCVPDLLQPCAVDDEATSNDNVLRSPAGSPIPVQDLMRRIDELC